MITQDAKADSTQQEGVPTEYQQFKELFKETHASKEEELLDHGPYDHEIPLKEGKQLAFKKVYLLNPT